jgi:hypothetical protein
MIMLFIEPQLPLNKQLRRCTFHTSLHRSYTICFVISNETIQVFVKLCDTKTFFYKGLLQKNVEITQPNGPTLFFLGSYINYDRVFH